MFFLIIAALVVIFATYLSAASSEIDTVLQTLDRDRPGSLPPDCAAHRD